MTGTSVGEIGILVVWWAGTLWNGGGLLVLSFLLARMIIAVSYVGGEAVTTLGAGAAVVDGTITLGSCTWSCVAKMLAS